MNRKFGRIKGRRKSFLQGLAHNLIIRGKMTTTEARAKEIRPLVESLVTVAKKQDLAGLRHLLASLPAQSANKLYYDIGPRYQSRVGGYLRIVKQGARRMRDGAKQAVIEFV